MTDHMVLSWWTYLQNVQLWYLLSCYVFLSPKLSCLPSLLLDLIDDLKLSTIKATVLPYPAQTSPLFFFKLSVAPLTFHCVSLFILYFEWVHPWPLLLHQWLSTARGPLQYAHQHPDPHTLSWGSGVPQLTQQSLVSSPFPSWSF